ncbi:uncharacterized protein LOC117176490 [Belonocnema kinseyi]|uniref:uncharacterized protein LOC117176490 n=1 Tax=Belonocnema kinseyi TaxID=2817044 RepID=UPI00143D6B4D|nr:uncharacterized protein LOC117176490 [Belonocnema kinseyi]
MSLDPSETIKTLGLFWNPRKDSILYTVNLTEPSNRVSKRSIFSQIAKLFDPLGLLGPVIVTAKIFIQSLWKTQLSWDDEVPPNLHKTSLEYRNQLPLLNHIQLNRCISVKNCVELQIHGFGDASEKAYGACLYLRSTDNQGKYHVSLICSKSRVAPMKQITIPKLELCAAFLLANLFTSTCKSLKLKVNKIQLWSDSTIALHWINSPSYTLNTFVANRVSEIQTFTDPHDWRHAPTHENPADLISRGQSPHEFLVNKFWQHGPQWLCQDYDTWPQVQFHQGDDPEKRKDPKIISCKITSSDWNILEKYSSIRTLNRVLAYCLRFIRNAKNKDKISGPLSEAELDASHLSILKLTQSAAFSKEIRSLSQGKNIGSDSKLLSLNPFLDKGILKVGGRLENTKIPENQKHLILLR